MCVDYCYYFVISIENVGRLKYLEYLNLALNNITKIENLSGIRHALIHVHVHNIQYKYISMYTHTVDTYVHTKHVKLHCITLFMHFRTVL